MRLGGSVRELVRALSQRLGEQSFAVVDHWDADSTAIGIASVRDPRVLVYVSVNEDAPRYFVSFETPPAGEWAYHPYTPGEQTSVGTLDELASLVEKHITSYAA